MSIASASVIGRGKVVDGEETEMTRDTARSHFGSAE